MIAYGICGEGRGHACRALSVVDQLRSEHEFELFAARDAYQFLKSYYEPDANVKVHSVPGLHFRYVGRRISYLGSMLGTVPYLYNLRRNVEQVVSKLRSSSCQLVISDFEPITARAARVLGVPLVTLDHQSFVTHMKLDGLSPLKKAKTFLMRPFIPLHYGEKPDVAIVSSFFAKQLQTPAEVCNTGVLVRSQLLNQVPEHGAYLLVYMRRHKMDALTHLLSTLGCRVIVYTEQPSENLRNIEFRQIGNPSFCDDLIHCDALICNAGNQLVGEALYLQKPVLAIPEPGNHEQMLNGHFLSRTNVGDSLEQHQLNELSIREFLEKLPEYRRAIEPQAFVGNEDVLRRLKSMLQTNNDKGNRVARTEMQAA